MIVKKITDTIIGEYMKIVIVLLAIIAFSSFFILDNSCEVKACFGCECTDSCGDSGI